MNCATEARIDRWMATKKGYLICILLLLLLLFFFPQKYQLCAGSLSNALALDAFIQT